MKLTIQSNTAVIKFSNVFTNLSALTSSVSMFFREDGLYIQGMDNSHISLYEVNFHKSWFTTYKREPDEAEKITVNLEYLKRVLSTRGDKQIISIEYKGRDPNKLGIAFRTVVKNSKEFPREYEMNLMDIDEEMLNITLEEQSVVFFMETKMFSSLIKQLAMFDEMVIVNCNLHDVNFRTKGAEGSMSVNLMNSSQDYIDQFEIEEDYVLKIYFAIRYIDSFCSFSKVSDRVRLSFSNDRPLEVYYSLDDEEDKVGATEDTKSWLRLLLAPKIMDDEDEERYKEDADEATDDEATDDEEADDDTD